MKKEILPDEKQNYGRGHIANKLSRVLDTKLDLIEDWLGLEVCADPNAK